MTDEAYEIRNRYGDPIAIADTLAQAKQDVAYRTRELGVRGLEIWRRTMSRERVFKSRTK